MTFSTSDNSQPPQAAPPRVTAVRLGVMLPVFATADADYGRFWWSPTAGVYQALREINLKADGIADDLLPHTQLLVASIDS
eukprot:3527099-Prymnesium_polylepis.1